MKLKKMVFLTIFLCAVVPVLALSAVFIAMSAKTSRNLMNDNMAAASRLFSNSIDNIFDINRADILVTFHVAEVRSFINKSVFGNRKDSEAVRNIANRLKLRVESDSSSIRYISLVDVNGKVLLNSDITKIGTHTRLPAGTIEQIKKSGQYFVTNIFRIKEFKDPFVYAIMLPLIDHHEFHGSMFYVLSPASIQEMVRSTEFFRSYRSGSVTVLDSGDNIVATSNPLLRGVTNFRTEVKDSNLLTLVSQNNISGDQAGAVRYTAGGRKRIGYLHTVPDSDWKIICSVEEDELFNPVRRMIIWDCMFVVLLLMIVTGAFTLLMKQITDPMYGLLSTIHRMRGGDYAARFDYKGRDEFREIADAYNDLADITQSTLKREKAHSEFLLDKSNHDQLTGLYNKTATEELISECIGEYGMADGHVLYIMDIDNFKSINDSLGHSLGDRALAELAKHLSAAARESDVVGRIGGDEFMVFLKSIKNTETVSIKAEELRNAFHTAGAAIPELAKMSGSIGCSRYPDDGSTFEELYKKADKALYETKASGKDGWTIYGIKRRNNGNAV